MNFAKNGYEDWWIEYYGFKTKVVPNSLVLKDPFLKMLFDMRPFTAGILKLNPHEVYDWHVDAKRGVTVNMLLDGFDSQCLFKDTAVCKEILMPYKQGTYFLFDTQKYHKVCNGNSTRYLFSVEFNETLHTLTYDKLYDELRVLCC